MGQHRKSRNDALPGIAPAHVGKRRRHAGPAADTLHFCRGGGERGVTRAAGYEAAVGQRVEECCPHTRSACNECCSHSVVKLFALWLDFRWRSAPWSCLTKFS